LIGAKAGVNNLKDFGVAEQVGYDQKELFFFLFT